MIVGENGVGKSNLLHALRLVLDPDLPDSARRLRAEDIHEGALGPLGRGLQGGAEVVIEVELSGFDDDEEAIAILSGALVKISNPMRARLTYRYAPIGQFPIGNSLEDTEGDSQIKHTPADYEYDLTQGEGADTDAGRMRRYVSLRVLPALRDAENDLERWNRSPLRTLLEELNLDPGKLKTVAADIDAAADKLAKDPKIDDLQKRLSGRLKALVGPQLPVDPSVGVASADPNSLLRNLRLFVDAARTRNVADTSLGAANVLYLGMLMEALAVQRQASAFVSTILAVEEPEAHLHVATQRRLFRHLLLTEPALLLTTHSPHIAAVGPLASLLLLRRVGNQTVATTTLDSGLSELESADISRYLDVSRAELLFARYVLLVEGAAEAILLPAIARAANFDLDEHGVVVVNVAGTDFSPYRKLLGPDGLNLPSAVLTDGDPLPGKVKAEHGLTRAKALLRDQPRRALLDLGIGELKAHLEAGREAESLETRRRLQDLCSEEQIFVGDQTLELDLLLLLGDELAAAYAELSTPKKGANMARDIIAVASDQGAEAAIDGETQAIALLANREIGDQKGTGSRQARILGRAESVGKGRLAQRWASHVECIDLEAGVVNLIAILRDEVEAAGAGTKNPDSSVKVEDAGAVRACLRALDWASQSSRGVSLFAGRGGTRDV